MNFGNIRSRPKRGSFRSAISPVCIALVFARCVPPLARAATPIALSRNGSPRHCRCFILAWIDGDCRRDVGKGMVASGLVLAVSSAIVRSGGKNTNGNRQLDNFWHQRRVGYFSPHTHTHTKVEEVPATIPVFENSGLELTLEEICDDGLVDEVRRARESKAKRQAHKELLAVKLAAAARDVAARPAAQLRLAIAWTPGRGLSQPEAKHYMPSGYGITKDMIRHFRWVCRASKHHWTTSRTFGRDSTPQGDNDALLAVLRSAWKDCLDRTGERCPWQLDGDLFVA